MIVTIHQPEHQPWLGYFHKMSLADTYVILDTVQFRKNYFQNRNRILGGNGPMWLTVPIQTKGHTEQTLATTRISHVQKWQKKYWKSICLNYSKHPYFELYIQGVKSIVLAPYEFIVDFNMALIDFFTKTMEMDVKFVKASNLGVDGKRSHLLLDICRTLDADIYLAGPSGADYLDTEIFDQAGIGVEFHAFSHPEYPQYGQRKFVPYMSVMDLLFNCGPESYAVIESGGGIGRNE